MTCKSTNAITYLEPAILYAHDTRRFSTVARRFDSSSITSRRTSARKCSANYVSMIDPHSPLGDFLTDDVFAFASRNWFSRPAARISTRREMSDSRAFRII